VVADVVLSGHVPRIKRAIGLVARGTQRGLRTTSVRGMADIDPESQDFFRRVIELRKTVERDPSIGSDEGRRLSRFLKVFASAASYGILAEFQRRESADPVDVSVYADGDCFDTSTLTPEEPGPYCFPPLAAVITGGARLVLARSCRASPSRGRAPDSGRRRPTAAVTAA
jgi:hypothetical protein